MNPFEGSDELIKEESPLQDSLAPEESPIHDSIPAQEHAEWTLYQTPEGDSYYYNDATGETLWENEYLKLQAGDLVQELDKSPSSQVPKYEQDDRGQHQDTEKIVDKDVSPHSALYYELGIKGSIDEDPRWVCRVTESRWLML